MKSYGKHEYESMIQYSGCDGCPSSEGWEHSPLLQMQKVADWESFKNLCISLNKVLSAVKLKYVFVYIVIIIIHRQIRKN